MVRLMHTLDIFLGLKSNQGHVAADFLHTNIGEGENIYVNIPKCFEQYSKTGLKKCLNLKNTLCGLHQGSHEFWNYLPKNWRRLA